MAKAKIVILTAEVLSSGLEAVKKAIAANADGVAADIIVISNNLTDAEKTALELGNKLNKATADKATLEALLKEKLAVLQNELDEAKAELQDALDVNASLTAEVEKLSKAPTIPHTFNTASFEVGGQEYGFGLPHVHFKGKLITWKDVLESKELQTDLIAQKSGLLKAL